MRRKNKLPSGTYRIRASCYDPDGTRHQKSFSAPTKAEAEEMRDTWMKDHAAGTYNGVLTAVIDMEQKRQNAVFLSHAEELSKSK